MAGNIHYWGLSGEKATAFKKKYPFLHIEFPSGIDNCVKIGTGPYNVVIIRNFTSDCGAVQLAHASSATKEILDAIKDYCSLSGYSVVIATLVSREIEGYVNLYESCGYKVVDSGHSNRTSSKKHAVLVMRIAKEDMIKKGY